MAIYYIDPAMGREENDGLSEQTPKQRENQVRVAPGDTVLFRRGSVIRDRLYNVNGAEGAPVTYGAYGEGPKPVFHGGTDCSDPALWHQTAPCIWETNGMTADEVGNIVFNLGESCGVFRWRAEDLAEQGDFFDNAFGCREGHSNKAYPEVHRVMVYSRQNPGIYYSHIECVTYRHRVLADAGRNQIIQDLCFTHNGVHAIANAAQSRNLHIRRCDFSFIGGCAWSEPLHIRFGNGVEMWEQAEDVSVCDCTFDQIYDSAVTHQGSDEGCRQAAKLIIRGNTFARCGMAAYEQRDRMPLYGEFCDNLCRDAGVGFSAGGETMPRRSEIWPQPMGHHVFLWRMEKPEAQSVLKIENNRFGNAVYGAAVYSIISPTCEGYIRFANNVYCGDYLLAARFGGRNMKTVEEFTGEKE